MTPYLIALNATSGAQAWTHLTSAGSPDPALSCGRSVVLLSDSGSGTLTGLEAGTGRLLWSFGYGAGGLRLKPAVNEAAAPGGWGLYVVHAHPSSSRTC